MLRRSAVHLGTITASWFSIIWRLMLIGYQLHQPVRENPVMRNLKPPELIDALELLFYYNNTYHLMWYVPLLLMLLFFFSGCFYQRKQQETTPSAAWILLVPNATYH